MTHTYDLITDEMVETAAGSQWHYEWPRRKFRREPVAIMSS